MIYFDNAATTKPCANALKCAEKFNDQMFYNPSALYRGGLANSKEIKQAKDSILSCIGANSGYELIFTSCGTESDNLATFCCVKRGVYLTDMGEHAAIHQAFLTLKNKGESINFVSLNSDGSVNTNELYEFIKDNRVDFVSIMHVNNETGAINDINTIARNVKALNPKIIFHSDGVQAFGKIPFNISEDIDLYSISAHKINGLKGVGALIKKKKLNLSPYIIGGGQENGYRSGTENIFGIKVFDYVASEHYKNLISNYNKVNQLNEFVKMGLNKEIFTIISSEKCSPYILSVSASGLKGEVIMHSLEEYGIYVGNGSACSSKHKYSRVIEACGYKPNVLDGVIRISFSHENTQEEAEKLVDSLNEIAIRLKGIIKK